MTVHGLPVVTLWGYQDQVFHVSGVEVLRQRLPKGQHKVMAETGHLPMMEHPSRTARQYRELLHRVLADHGSDVSP